MIFRLAAALLGATLVLSACDGDSRPFYEAVEVRTLNLESIGVSTPINTLPEIFLNINQSMQLGVLGNPGTESEVLLAANNRAWAVSDPSIVSITENGFLRALANGAVDVSVSIGGIDSVGFGLTVSDATLSGINAISGATTLERCLPQAYFATGTFSDDTNRNLDNVSWVVSDPTNAHLFESSGTSTKLNAMTAMDQLTLTATTPDGLSLDQPLIVADNLQTIQIRPLRVSLDIDAVSSLTAVGNYSASTIETVVPNRDVLVTDNVDWSVVTGTNNLSISNVRGSKGLLTGLAVGDDNIIEAACGAETFRALVDIVASGTSTTLAFKIGTLVITGDQISLSRVANLASIPILASTGSTYDADNDVTSTVDFQIQNSTSSVTTPFVIDGNGTATPSLRFTATGTVTLVATETTDNIAVGSITITVTN
ncbi:MAG: hypothetical protein ACI8VW_002387 [bacterium]|jgi:hypothetical protein